MEIEEIKQLIEAVSESELEELDYEENGVKLHLGKRPKHPDHGPKPPMPPMGGPMPPQPGPMPGMCPPPEGPVDKSEADKGGKHESP